MFGLILHLLPGGLGGRKYKPKRPLWLQSACLALFCGSFWEVWGEGNISPNGHFGFKVLVWPYSAHTEERSSQRKNKPKTTCSIPKCLFGPNFCFGYFFSSPHVTHNKSAKHFELNNLARNIPPVLRDCGLNGLPWQTRIGRIRDWD